MKATGIYASRGQTTVGLALIILVICVTLCTLVYIWMVCIDYITLSGRAQQEVINAANKNLAPGQYTMRIHLLAKNWYDLHDTVPYIITNGDNTKILTINLNVQSKLLNLLFITNDGFVMRIKRYAYISK